MGILRNDDSVEAEMYGGIRGKECAHCGSTIEESVGIVWRLTTCDPEFFHTACATEFAIRLLRDVHEIECRDSLRIAMVHGTS